MSYPNGCHIAEVEIDPETGNSSIERYIAVDDLGNVINSTLVEGQVHGGVMQGAGQVFGEHAIYDPGDGTARERDVRGLLHAARGNDQALRSPRAPGADAD